MTVDPRRQGPREPLDDARLGSLIRDVADGWRMPPVRLDAPSWRDRVRSPGARRLAAAGSWVSRLGQAATAAIALTVVGALLAVMLTRPPDSAAPSDSPPPGSTEPAQASNLPKLLVEGDLPRPARVLVQTEQGDFALANLADGTIGGPITGTSRGSELQVRADGSLVCLCVTVSGSVGGSPTDATVKLEWYDIGGNLVSSDPVDAFTGAPDPRDAGVFIPENPPHVLTAMGFSDGGRYGFVGWSKREHPVWRSGIVVVDLQRREIVSRLELPDASTGEGDARRVYDAPRVVGSAGGDRVLVARGWHEWSPAQSETPAYRFESDVYRTRLAGGQLTDPVHVPLAAADCGRVVDRGGPLPDGGAWIACSAGGAALTIVRRLGPDGSLLGDLRVTGSDGIDGGGSTALSPDGSQLYVWDPGTATITRIDLASGLKETGNGLTARGDGGGLAAFGHWLAPTATAKTFLRGSVVVSPDGTRVYAIGIKEGVDELEMAGSAGVFVFDATSLESLGTWQPTADFVSLAISSDGRFVYAAGLPGFDYRGRRQAGQGASITVFDARDGSVRLIAGALGRDLITFLPTLLD